MAQNTEYRIGIVDEYWLARSKSPCGQCSLLIDVNCDFICQKFPQGIPEKHWNKEKICSDIISECMSNSYHEVHIVLITHHELAFGIQIASVR